MAWGAALGQVVSSLTEGMASAAQYQAAKHERNVSWRRQQAWELMAPGLRVEGLKRAGLNPILAATQGMSGGPGHVATGSPGGQPRFRYDHGAVIAAAKQSKAMDDQLKILHNEAERSYHEAGKAGEEWSRASEEVKLVREQVQNLIAERGYTNARTIETGEATRRMAVDRLLMELGVPGARAMEELYTKYPQLRQLREFGGAGLAPAAAGAAGYLFHRGASRAKGQMENFGSLVPGNPKRRKK